MRYLLINPEEIQSQTDITYKPRTPLGQVILTESEAKALDDFQATFVSAKVLKRLIAEQEEQLQAAQAEDPLEDLPDDPDTDTAPDETDPAAADTPDDGTAAQPVLEAAASGDY